MKGILTTGDNKKFRIEYDELPKVTVNTIPTYHEGKYSGEKPIGYKWSPFSFKSVDIDRIPHPLDKYTFIDGTIEYHVVGRTEYKGGKDYTTIIREINQRI